MPPVKQLLFTCRWEQHVVRETLQGMLHTPGFVNEWAIQILAMPFSLRTFRARLAKNRPDAFFLWHMPPGADDDAAAARRTGLVVVVDARRRGKAFAHCLVDHAAVGRMAADHFLEKRLPHFAFLGCRDIAFFQRQLQGFRQRLREAGHDCATFLCPPSLNPMDPIRHTRLPREVARWARDLPRPCALFAGTDRLGVLALRLCRNLGLKTPEEMAVLGVGNDSLLCHMVHPALSSVRLPYAEMDARKGRVDHVAQEIGRAHV